MPTTTRRTAHARGGTAAPSSGAATESREPPVIAGPGAVVWFPTIFTDWKGVQTALKLEYQYYRDNSNDATRSFDDHIVATSLVMRF